MRSVSRDVPEGGVDLGEAEFEAEPFGFLRDNPLPVEHHRGHLAEQEPHSGRGRGKQTRPVEGAAQRFRELLHRDRIRSGAVDRAPCLWVLHREDEQGHEVVAVDPRHPLFSVSDRSAGEHLERRKHLREGASVSAEHDPRPDQRHAHAERLRLLRGLLPRHARRREEIGSGRAVLVEGLVAVGAVVPDGDETLDEDSPPGTDFLATTCVAWEEAAKKAEALGVRVALLRTGDALGGDGGALAKMLPPFKMFAGGPIGNGEQWMSWIHRDDLVALFVFAMENPKARGPINGTAPNPVTMKEFAKALGRALHRPSLFPAPAAAVRLLLGEMATVVLDGQRVVPKKAEGLGFKFRFTEVDAALRDVTGD